MTSKKLTFEKAREELEEIIANLESEEVPLEKAIALFERGITLVRTCNERLSAAEGKIRELCTGDNGELVEKILGTTRESADGDDA